MIDPAHLRDVNERLVQALEVHRTVDLPAIREAREELRAELAGIPERAKPETVLERRLAAVVAFEAAVTAALRARRVDADQREWLAQRFDALPASLDEIKPGPPGK